MSSEKALRRFAEQQQAAKDLMCISPRDLLDVLDKLQAARAFLAAPATGIDVEHGCPKCGTVTQPRWHYNDWRKHPTCNERARNEGLRLKEPIDGEHLHYICECGHERVAAIADASYAAQDARGAPAAAGGKAGAVTSAAMA